MATEAGEKTAREVLITGAGVVCPFGTDMNALLDGVWQGADGFTGVAERDEPWRRATRAAVVSRFNPRDFIPPMKLRRMDACSAYAVSAGVLAFRDAGLAGEAGGEEASADALSRAGVVMGTGTAGSSPVVEYLEGLLGQAGEGQFPMIFPNTVPNAPAGQLAIRFGIRGPNLTCSQGGCSALLALAWGAQMIRTGRCELVLAGGVDEFSPVLFSVFDRMRALSPGRSGLPEACRPFDRQRNGWMMGAGAYLLVLESEAGAARRGAPARARLLGTGISSGCSEPDRWPEEATGYTQCMGTAMKEGGVAPERVGAVLASANGHPVLDRLEAEAIESLFSSAGAAPPPVSAVKAVLGECSAVGAAQAIVGAACFRRRSIPPTRNFSDGGGETGIEVVCGEPRTLAPADGAIVVNSFAAGGGAVSLVLAPPADGERADR